MHWVFTLQLAANYPLVAKSLRDIRSGKAASAASHSCCGGQFSEGLGYEDLNELLKSPQDLEFILGKGKNSRRH